ncbi:GSCOCG00005756001-RA-CDS [Cotesia congregata]|nr:GSCOCG00005756001-RA-CDS [Cotesia congregata]
MKLLTNLLKVQMKIQYLNGLMKQFLCFLMNTEKNNQISPSKFSGMKKTYKKIKYHNNKSGNSAKHWPYLTLMDDLMGDKPFISPLATCSSTGKKKKGHYLNAVMKVAQVVMRIILQPKKNQRLHRLIS